MEIERNREGTLDSAGNKPVHGEKKAKINAIWEQLNSNNPSLSSRAGHGSLGPSARDPKVANMTPGWMKNLRMALKKPASESKSSSPKNGGKVHVVTSAAEFVTVDIGVDQTGKVKAVEEAARKVASASFATAKAITDGKIEIDEVRNFAGEALQVTKYVDPNSEVDSKVRRKTEVQTLSGLDALLEHVGKKHKLNILDKSRKDWGEFKEEKGIVCELEQHIKSGDKYTDKVAFLQRTDMREYERERDARMVLSKTGLDHGPLD